MSANSISGNSIGAAAAYVTFGQMQEANARKAKAPCSPVGMIWEATEPRNLNVSQMVTQVRATITNGGVQPGAPIQAQQMQVQLPVLAQQIDTERKEHIRICNALWAEYEQLCAIPECEEKINAWQQAHPTISRVSIRHPNRTHLNHLFALRGQFSTLLNRAIVECCYRIVKECDPKKSDQIREELGRSEEMGKGIICPINIPTQDAAYKNKVPYALQLLKKYQHKLRNVEYIDLTGAYVGGSFDLIPYEILLALQQCTKLKGLSLLHGNLRTLPSTICELTSLEKLRIDRSAITEISTEIGKLKRLQHFNISHTRVQGLPDALLMLKSLRSMDVEGSGLSEQYLDNALGRLMRQEPLTIQTGVSYSSH